VTVPTYLPNRLSTADWLGSTMYRPIRQNTARTATTAAPTIWPMLWPETPLKNSQAATSRATISASRVGMPGNERIGFSFMGASLVVVTVS